MDKAQKELEQQEEKKKYISQLTNELIMYNNTLSNLHNTAKHKKPRRDAEENLERMREDTVQKLLKEGLSMEEIRNIGAAEVNGANGQVKAKEINPTVMPTPTVDAGYENMQQRFDTTIPTINGYSKNTDVQYDIIELPSKGQAYANKKCSVAVAFMTAADENMITSPNLYRDGLLIDYLLKNKVIEEGFDADDLCNGDADAITVWLRSTAYGPEFPVTITDPETGNEFEYIIDLTQLKEKPFNLVSDENGCFDYTVGSVEHSDLIKFRFLTRRDERLLKKMEAYENTSTKKLLILQDLNEIAGLLSDDNSIDGMNDSERNEIVERLTEWSSKAATGATTNITHIITNRMEMQIYSINGNTDKEFIHNYVMNMRAKDSLDFRRYVLSNEPGMDFEVEVERPESLGGGSFKTFLPWDDSIFYHIA